MSRENLLSDAAPGGHFERELDVDCIMRPDWSMRMVVTPSEYRYGWNSGTGGYIISVDYKHHGNDAMVHCWTGGLFSEQAPDAFRSRVGDFKGYLYCFIQEVIQLDGETARMSLKPGCVSSLHDDLHDEEEDTLVFVCPDWLRRYSITYDTYLDSLRLDECNLAPIKKGPPLVFDGYAKRDEQRKLHSVPARYDLIAEGGDAFEIGFPGGVDFTFAVTQAGLVPCRGNAFKDMVHMVFVPEDAGPKDHVRVQLNGRSY